ncbi:MAG: aminotransferase class I/II-fold pyridoxal phosphate-dependent enzyme, partial [Methylosarcina sp.]
MAEIFSQLAEDLESIAARGLYRSRRIASSPQGVVLTIDGRTLLNFCSNDYLGLANHPSVVAAFKRGADRYGIGSGSAHLLCGHSSAHHALEEELAEFTGRARSLLFSTGYMANMGIISALAERGDTVLEDRLNHASLLDGGLLSAAQFKRYRHVDLAHLEANLAESSGRKLIVTDGVFSMDGDLAPMDQLSLLAQQQNAWLMVDDAHGLGVI